MYTEGDGQDFQGQQGRPTPKVRFYQDRTL